MNEPTYNRAGRPYGIPRMHLNRHGLPKPALTRADAIGKALDYDVERALDPRRRGRGPVQAYECSHCGTWHIGTRRRKLRQPVERIEVGDRVWWNLTAENRGQATKRLAAIGLRVRRRGREAIPPRQAA